MARRSAEIIWLAPEYVLDKAACLAALRIAQRDGAAILAREEAHFRACATCSVGGPDGMCLEGQQIEAQRAARAVR